MIDDVTSARCGLCARGLIKVCVVVLAITGQALWVGMQVSAIRATLDTDVYRLDILERLGSPAVGEIRMLQMRALQSVEQRRVDAVEATCGGLKERLDTLSHSAETLRELMDRHAESDVRFQARAATVATRLRSVMSLLQNIQAQQAGSQSPAAPH